MSNRKKARRDPADWLVREAIGKLAVEMDEGDVLTDIVVVGRVVNFESGTSGIVHASNTNWLMEGGMLEATRDLWHSSLPWKRRTDLGEGESGLA